MVLIPFTHVVSNFRPMKQETTFFSFCRQSGLPLRIPEKHEQGSEKIPENGDCDTVPRQCIFASDFRTNTNSTLNTLIRLSILATGILTGSPALHGENEDHEKRDFKTLPVNKTLTEVTVSASQVNRIRQSAYNAIAIDTKERHNSTLNLSNALANVPGLKLRESGGVGSDIQFMMDGFNGKHIKIFIDGVPQEGVGSAFGLNNIPINFAERIEVYKGVVPVEFGTDALGGVINIVTGKKRKGWSIDASYAYGSFHTHKSYVNFSQTLKNGLTYEINAFQNYSDNNYRIDTPVEQFNADGTTSLNSKRIERVKRFNDTYHNEAVIGKIGITGKPWADRLMLGITYSQFYKEIQNGVVQKVVFGRKHRKGHSVMPALEYSKRNLFTRGLNLTLTANYNDNQTQHIDTSAYRFNWLGEQKYQNGQLGEQTYQDNTYENRNWNSTMTAHYRIGHKHTFVLNQVFSAFQRKNRSSAATSGNSAESEAIAKETRKLIGGLSYRLIPSDKWNISVFGKYYNQFNAGPASTSASGTDNYVRITNRTSTWGYGTAGTYFPLKGLQAKLSYEKAYRLPTNEELFGDEDMELGKIGLKPERSDNLNLSLSYHKRMKKHYLYIEGGWVYRNTKDFIQRTLANLSGNKTYAMYENHGHVKTKGYNFSARYNWANRISAGGNFTRLDTRNRVRTLGGNTSQESLTYGVRIPNQPYMFAGSDLSINWDNLPVKGSRITLGYDNLYMHSFPLYWENLGSSRSKEVVPTQLAHNLSLTYSMQNGRYNLSLECRNFTNEKLYDNFSLQKAGRAFYGKIRVCLGN